MPLYFFHVDSDSVRDDAGIELENIAAARSHSFLLLDAACEELGGPFADGKEWVVTIADEYGRNLLRFELLIRQLSEEVAAGVWLNQTH